MHNHTSDAPISRSRLFALAAMIFSAAGVGAGISLGLPLLSIVLAARGVSGSMIGLNTAMAGIASLVVIPFVTPIATKIGAHRLLLLSLFLTGISFYGFYLVDNFWLWFPLRLVFHGGLSTAFVMSEFWINSLSPTRRRGLIMGIYATVLSLASRSVRPYSRSSAVTAICPLPSAR